MASAYIDSLDIANLACQHLGVRAILDLNEDTVQNIEISRVYDQVRQDELRRNRWRFAKKRCILRAMTQTTRIIQPQQWDSSVAYKVNDFVTDSNGNWWYSVLAGNIGNEPGTSAVWDAYYGPMTADLWDSSQFYYAGELVYKAASPQGGFIVFLCQQNGTQDVPDTATVWSATTQYGLDDRVSYGGQMWRSLITFNLNNTPATAPDPWNNTHTYHLNDTISAGDGYVYTSLTTNTNVDPLSDNGINWSGPGVPVAWSVSPLQVTASNTWLPVACNMINQSLEWLQLQLGPNAYTQKVNVFHLPAGYLREMKIDPKHATMSRDWEYSGDYFSSFDSITLFSFIGDVVDVRRMDPLFCKALGAAIAMQVCEVVTQSGAKLQACSAKYLTFITEASDINGIELGPEEPDEDDYITIRL
jgi:hypothetical protein